jgi:prepilin-type N-terminal cleavage/methylation domain-containing protein/prepilin-type processing-associated H-X9-DG protein
MKRWSPREKSPPFLFLFRVAKLPITKSIQKDCAMVISRKAFTLVELLVVIAIIAILVSILLPTLNKARDQARAVVCLNNMRGIGFAMNMYAEDNDDYIPRDADTVNWILAFMPYISDSSGKVDDYRKVKSYQCPNFPTKGIGANGYSNSEQTVNYVVNAWSFADESLPDGTQASGPTQRDLFPAPNAVIYLADNEAGEWRPIIRSKEEMLIASAYSIFDVWSSVHLPSSNVETGDQSRRVARDRHRYTGCNNLFVDGHVQWVSTEDSTRLMWGGRR